MNGMLTRLTRPAGEEATEQGIMTGLLHLLLHEPTGTTEGALENQGTPWSGGALGGTRTPNLLIRSQMLYPLSYERRACLDSVRRPGSLLAAVGPSPAMICCRVDVYLPEQGDDPEELLARVISPPHFPIRPKQLGNGWPFNAVQPGHHEFEGFSVDAREIPHKGGRTKAVARSATGSATVPARWLTLQITARRPSALVLTAPVFVTKRHHAGQRRRPARPRFPAHRGPSCRGWASSATRRLSTRSRQRPATRAVPPRPVAYRC